jgi:hypothetical protein
MLSQNLYFALIVPICFKRQFPSESALLNSWSRALLEKPPVVQLLKNFPAFYGTRRFITVLTRALESALQKVSNFHSKRSPPARPISN